MTRRTKQQPQISSPARLSISVIPKLYTSQQVGVIENRYSALLTFNLETTDRFNAIANLLEGVQRTYRLVGIGAKFRADPSTLVPMKLQV